MNFRVKKAVIIFVYAVFLFSAFEITAQDDSSQNNTESENNYEEITKKEAELNAIQEKLKVLNVARLEREKERRGLVNAIDIINDNIQATLLEIDKTNVSIDIAGDNLKKNLKETEKTEEKVNKLRSDMEEIIREMNTLDKISLWHTVVSGGTFTDFLQASGSLRSMQNKLMTTLYLIQDSKKILEKQRKALQEKQDDLEKLLTLQDAQKRSLAGQETQKKDALKKTVSQQKKISGLITEAEDARKEIQQKLFSLKNAGISMSLTDAVSMAKYAGKVTGVRPALLLGVLKIESNLGTNVGSGKYPDDIHPLHREAFLRVVKKLGMEPSQAPVSAKPKSYPGWGGAMGPGQIMPGIWESIESTIAELTGKTVPSPYNLQDAFVATAVILRNSGAAGGNEYEAVNRYFAGGNWQRFTWYGDRVLAVAKQYEENGI